MNAFFFKACLALLLPGSDGQEVAKLLNRLRGRVGRTETDEAVRISQALVPCRSAQGCDGLYVETKFEVMDNTYVKNSNLRRYRASENPNLTPLSCAIACVDYGNTCAGIEWWKVDHPTGMYSAGDCWLNSSDETTPTDTGRPMFLRRVFTQSGYDRPTSSDPKIYQYFERVESSSECANEISESRYDCVRKCAENPVCKVVLEHKATQQCKFYRSGSGNQCDTRHTIFLKKPTEDAGGDDHGTIKDGFYYQGDWDVEPGSGAGEEGALANE